MTSHSSCLAWASDSKNPDLYYSPSIELWSLINCKQQYFILYDKQQRNEVLHLKHPIRFCTINFFFSERSKFYNFFPKGVSFYLVRIILLKLHNAIYFTLMTLRQSAKQKFKSNNSLNPSSFIKNILLTGGRIDKRLST